MLRLTFGGDHGFAFGDEEVDDVDGLVHESAAIASEVDDEALEVVLFLHLHEMLFHLVASIFGETAKAHVTDAVVKHGGVGDVVDLDFLAFEFEFDGLFNTVALDFDGHLGARLSLEQLADLVGRLLVGVYAVDGDDGVASLEACFLSWPSLVWIRDASVFAVILDQGTNAAVFAGGHQLVVFNFRLGDKHGVRVHLLEHGVDGGLVQFRRVDLVYVIQV